MKQTGEPIMEIISFRASDRKTFLCLFIDSRLQTRYHELAET